MPFYQSMSVLVEAISLIIRRSSLDRKFRGGTGAFLNYCASRLSSEHRYACADQNLVSLSYYTNDAAHRGAVPLLGAGLVEIENNAFADFAVVDQHFGPTDSCAWIEWSRDAAGFTSAWLAGELPGELCTPEGWTVEQSLQLKRADMSVLSDRALQLADENGVETWLDFATGRVITGCRLIR